MSNKASCLGATNVRPLVLEEENPKLDDDAAEKQAENNLKQDLSKLDLPPPLLALCQFAETKLKPSNETVRVNIPWEVFGYEHDTFILHEDILQLASMVEIEFTVIAVYMRYLFDYLKMANMANLVGLIDPRQVSVQFGSLSYRSKHLSDRLDEGHWVLIIVRLNKETVYYMDSLPNRSIDEDMRNIVNTAIKMSFEKKVKT
ncbi:hypothetical protein L3X38_041861 [Prunus dulcis]|uniref:Ubiquitin-like protease family profile domain-containing protein n=1 Tax=Prunus dulcis TaxID=3755 RepID=A0AAD4UVG5_PRUDU|nr:hypothetical protein L3X38_041861 [Prunus dulcis]